MPRPVKWARELHQLRERAIGSRTETWSRQDIERLFAISRPSAQNLMKAIGGIQTVGAAHFVDRSSLLAFLDEMIVAESVEAAVQKRLIEADPAPRPKALRVSLPDDLRHAMLPDLTPNVTLTPGRIEITADSATAMVESLFTLALIMQNDLDRWSDLIDPPKPVEVQDEELRAFLTGLRDRSASLT